MRDHRRLHSGSALISTLLAVVVLTIIVTAFLQSMTVERQTARSYLNRETAELAAEAGLADAEALLTNSLADSRFHYVVTYKDRGLATETAEVRVGILDSDELETAIELSSGQNGETTVIEVVGSGSQAAGTSATRTAAWKQLLDEDGDEIARFAYWLDAGSAKQNFNVFSGIPNRDKLESLSEIPLFSRNGLDLSNKLAANFATAQSSDPDLPSNLQLLTPKTVNHFISDNPTPITDFDATLNSPSALLTPEGNPKLNLTRLKRYLDGGTYTALDRRGNEVFSESYIQLPLEQGPSSERFELVKNLLNEDGNYPANEENDWGYGNLEILRTLFPELDGNGDPTQARQIVANILDYIDEDIIPTTDGSPGPEPAGAGTGISSPNNPNNNHILQPPPPRPTVFGLEARHGDDVDGGISEVRGHPYIIYIGQGFIFNGNGSFVSSSRLLGWFGLGYPWAQRARITIGADTRYQAELQFRLDGTVEGGNRGPNIQENYILRSWLAQQSGYSSDDAVRNGTKYFEPKAPGDTKGYSLFPRTYHGSFDLANGFYSISAGGVRFNSLTAYPEVARLIYYLNGQRYLVQEASMQADKARSWSPTSFPLEASPTKFKLGFGWSQIDWHYQGDPRMNFRAEGWSPSGTTGFSTATGYAPTSGDDMYAAQPNPDRDKLQTLGPQAGQWSRSEGTKNHFPTFAQGYEPSKEPGDVALRSLSELGFIHAGAPWQTLTMFHDAERFESPYETADWRLLDYVELGDSPRQLNAFDQFETDGLVNPNTPKRATIQALLTEIPSLAQPLPLINALTANSAGPFFKASDVLDDPVFLADGTTEFEKERLVGNVTPALTTSSQTFTIYSVGEARNLGRTLSRVTLVTEIQMLPTASGTSSQLTPKIIRQFVQ